MFRALAKSASFVGASASRVARSSALKMSFESEIADHPQKPETSSILKGLRSDHHQRRLDDVPEGLAFLSLVNSRMRFFLPSSQNYFDGFQVTKVLCDSGCSSILLPIESPEILGKIFAKFGGDGYKIEIKKINAVGGPTSCLNVEYVDLQKLFEVELCKDLMGSTSNVIKTKRLRFSLCVDDILAIRESYSEFLEDVSIRYLATATGPQKRRTHALLGQDISMKFCMIKYEHVGLYVNPGEYKLPSSFKLLRSQIESLEAQLRTELPDKFNDWEDDDFFFENDDKLVLTEDDLFID